MGIKMEMIIISNKEVSGLNVQGMKSGWDANVHTNRPYPFHMRNAMRKYLVSSELTEDDNGFVVEFEEGGE